jgi:hypothetical protein
VVCSLGALFAAHCQSSARAVELRDASRTDALAQTCALTLCINTVHQLGRLSGRSRGAHLRNPGQAMLEQRPSSARRLTMSE